MRAAALKLPPDLRGLTASSETGSLEHPRPFDIAQGRRQGLPPSRDSPALVEHHCKCVAPLAVRCIYSVVWLGSRPSDEREGSLRPPHELFGAEETPL